MYGDAEPHVLCPACLCHCTKKTEHPLLNDLEIDCPSTEDLGFSKTLAFKSYLTLAHWTNRIPASSCRLVHYCTVDFSSAQRSPSPEFAIVPGPLGAENTGGATPGTSTHHQLTVCSTGGTTTQRRRVDRDRLAALRRVQNSLFGYKLIDSI